MYCRKTRPLWFEIIIDNGLPVCSWLRKREVKKTKPWLLRRNEGWRLVPALTNGEYYFDGIRKNESVHVAAGWLSENPFDE